MPALVIGAYSAKIATSEAVFFVRGGRNCGNGCVGYNQKASAMNCGFSSPDRRAHTTIGNWTDERRGISDVLSVVHLRC